MPSTSSALVAALSLFSLIGAQSTSTPSSVFAALETAGTQVITLTLTSPFTHPANLPTTLPCASGQINIGNNLCLSTISLAPPSVSTPTCSSGYTTAANPRGGTDLVCEAVVTTSPPFASVSPGVVTTETVLIVDGHPATIGTIETTLGMTEVFFYTSNVPTPTGASLTAPVTCPLGFGTLDGVQCVQTSATPYTLPSSHYAYLSTLTTTTATTGASTITGAASVGQISDGQVQASTATATATVAPYKGAASSMSADHGVVAWGVVMGAAALGAGLML